MGDRHDWWFKFLCGAYSLLRVGGDAAFVHEAVVGGDGLTGVPDVHAHAFAGRIARSLAGPGHAGLFASLLGGVDVVSLDHVANVLVSRRFEALDELFIGIRVHDGARPGVGPGRGFDFGLAMFLPFGTSIDRGIDQVVPLYQS